MKRFPWLALLVVAALGCSRQAANLGQAAGSQPSAALHRVYEFEGKGHPPVFNRNPAKKVQWVEVGPRERSTIGDSLRGGSVLVETFAGGRVGTADGAVTSVKTITLTYGMGNALEAVESQ